MRVISTTAFACILALCTFAATTTASAARLGEVAARYNQLNDAGFVAGGSVTASLVTDYTPKPLTYLGHNIRYDLTVGRYAEGDGNGPVTIVYAGPTWLYQPDFLWRGGYIDFGSAVSYISNDHIGDHNMGGHFQFTSHVTLGHQFGAKRRWRIGLRLQHTSNAGIYDHNPGLDVLALELAYRFASKPATRSRREREQPVR